MPFHFIIGPGHLCSWWFHVSLTVLFNEFVNWMDIKLATSLDFVSL